MELNDIQEKTCAHCGAAIVSESVRSVHTNGHGFEVREFKCGREVAFIPNFMRVEVKRECPKAKSETKKTDKRKQAFAALTDFIDGLDVDATWKKDVQSSISYHEPRPYFRI